MTIDEFMDEAVMIGEFSRFEIEYDRDAMNIDKSMRVEYDLIDGDGEYHFAYGEGAFITDALEDCMADLRAFRDR